MGHGLERDAFDDIIARFKERLGIPYKREFSLFTLSPDNARKYACDKTTLVPGEHYGVLVRFEQRGDQGTERRRRAGRDCG